MTTPIPPLDTFPLDAVVVSTDSVSTEGGQFVRLLYADGEFGAWMLPPLPCPPPQSVLKARVNLLPINARGMATHVLTRMDPDGELDVFELIPDAFGAGDNCVLRLRDLADACTLPVLRQFLSDVFTLSEVFQCFWTCPASQTHHHAGKGGLARHSIEMAERVRDTPGMSELDRCIGIVFALIHDLGKIWCYDPNVTNLQQLGHDQVALARLHGPLEQLEAVWSDGAITLRSLLSGQWKRVGGKPLVAVGKLVQAFDQMSVESDLRPRMNHRYRPWTPTSPLDYESSVF